MLHQKVGHGAWVGHLGGVAVDGLAVDADGEHVAVAVIDGAATRPERHLVRAGVLRGLGEVAGADDLQPHEPERDQRKEGKHDDEDHVDLVVEAARARASVDRRAPPIASARGLVIRRGLVRLDVPVGTPLSATVPHGPLGFILCVDGKAHVRHDHARGGVHLVDESLALGRGVRERLGDGLRHLVLERLVDKVSRGALLC